MVSNFLTKFRGEHKIDNMDNLDFSEEEIQQQLAMLGYKTIPKHRLLEFKQDLDELIRHGQWKNLASPTPISIHAQTAASLSSLPAYTKEKVNLSYNYNSGDGFFLHEEKTGRDSTLSTTQKSEHNGRSLSCGDSYAALSVGPRLHFSAGAPNRLQEEPDTEDTLDSLLSDSYTSCSDHQQRRLIKRKVLRKRKGKSFICSESIYTDDSAKRAAAMYKMYNDQWDRESDDEKDSLYSSFWSDGEAEDKEEDVEIMRPVNDPEDSPPESSGEEQPQLKSPQLFNEGTLEEESDYSDDGKTTDGAAESPVTSGYGTYRAEEQNQADQRDDRSMNRFTQNSQEDLSEFRDDKEVSRLLSSFTECDNEPTHGLDVREPVAFVSDGVVDVKLPVEPEPKEQHLYIDADDTLLFHKKGLEDGIDGGGEEKQEKLLHNLKENAESVSAIDVKDESSRNKGVRFFNSIKDFILPDVSSCLEERMSELDLTSDRKDYDADENDSQGSESDAVDFPAFKPYSDVVTQSDREVRPKPKSFIRPMMCQRAFKKNDPVTRYFQYKEMWDAFQVPGDNIRKALRWEIKEKCSYQPLPKPRKVYVPNSYSVPTQKKRSELRWTIRNDLANRRLPQKFTSQF